MTSPIYIYGLVCPIAHAIRYVGKSIRPAERLANHFNEPPSNCHRSHWLQWLRRQEQRPTLVILEVIAPSQPWQPSERFWIAEGRRRGWPLTNNTSGGDGVEGLPPETREKMRRTWLGRKHRPETIAKLGSGMRGKHHSDEHRAHMRQIMRGRSFTPRWRSRIAEAVRKLSSADCETIMRRIGLGEKSCDLAREYRVHRTTIQKVKMGRYFERGQAEPAREDAE